MKLRSFRVYGFKSAKRYAHVDFSDHQSNVIYGLNGLGKTTLLQILSAFLSKRESTLTANNVSLIECVFVNDFLGVEHTVRVSKRDEGGYDWDTGAYEDFDGLKSLSIGVERGIAPQNISVSPEVIFDFMYRHSKAARRVFSSVDSSYSIARHRDSFMREEMRELSHDLSMFIRARGRNSRATQGFDFDASHVNLDSIRMDNIESILAEKYRETSYRAAKNIQTALFDTIAELVNGSGSTDNDHDLSPDFIRELKKYRERIKIALPDSEDNSFMKMVVQKLDSYCDEGVMYGGAKSPIFVQLFANMIKELRAEDENLNSVNVVVSAFNKHLEFGKKLVVDNSRTSYVDVDGDRHAISELSSGERHFLTFLTLMATAGVARDFVFIDEPEISLNLRWQREILGIIEEILPNTQIIVASHSQAITQDPSALCKMNVGFADDRG